jgi:galactokinase/mevalonate kinase-like predicted kinase
MRASTKEPLDNAITQEEIDRLIAERKSAGATSCRVVTEGGQRLLVTEWPEL